VHAGPEPQDAQLFGKFLPPRPYPTLATAAGPFKRRQSYGSPFRVRGPGSVRLADDLTIVAKLACTLARARAGPLAV
jgi:hypothetical protein